MKASLRYQTMALLIFCLLALSGRAAVAQKLQWSYTPTFPLSTTSAFILSVRADTLGGAVLIIQYGSDDETNFRLVWLSKSGKPRLTEELSDDLASVYRVSSAYFYIRTSSGLKRYSLKGTKTVTSELDLPDTMILSDDPLLEGRGPTLPDPSGFFVEQALVDGAFTLHRYRN